MTKCCKTWSKIHFFLKPLCSPFSRDLDRDILQIVSELVVFYEITLGKAQWFSSFALKGGGASFGSHCINLGEVGEFVHFLVTFLVLKSPIFNATKSPNNCWGTLCRMFRTLGFFISLISCRFSQIIPLFRRVMQPLRVNNEKAVYEVIVKWHEFIVAQDHKKYGYCMRQNRKVT